MFRIVCAAIIWLVVAAVPVFAQQQLQSILNSSSFNDASLWNGDNYLIRNSPLQGITNSKKAIVSFWVNLSGGNGLSQSIFAIITGAGSGRLFFSRTTGNVWNITARDASAVNAVSMSTVGTYTATDTWVHFLSSWDLTGPTCQLYMNNVSDASISVCNNLAVELDNATTLTGVAGNALLLGTQTVRASLYDLYVNTDDKLDLSLSINREKFISGGKPVFLGLNGERPTGTIPPFFFSGSINQWRQNKGYAGIFAPFGAMLKGVPPQ